MRFFPVLLTVMIAAFIVCFGCSAADGPAPIDNRAWLYNAEADVYYQLGIPYCGNPADETYENLAVFVPGSYFKASENGDGIPKVGDMYKGKKVGAVEKVPDCDDDKHGVIYIYDEDEELIEAIKY